MVSSFVLTVITILIYLYDSTVFTGFFGTLNRNRTYISSLGGTHTIHYVIRAYLVFDVSQKSGGGMLQCNLRRGTLYPTEL